MNGNTVVWIIYIAYACVGVIFALLWIVPDVWRNDGTDPKMYSSVGILYMFLICACLWPVIMLLVLDRWRFRRRKG